mgnify:CR=1 FL=1
MKYKKGRFVFRPFLFVESGGNQMIFRELIKTTIMAIGAM